MLLPIVIMNIENPSEREFMIGLYRDYHHVMFAVSYNILRSRSQAEDAVSASCEKLISKISTLMEIDSCALRSYIVSTTKNTAINMSVKSSREQSRSVYYCEDKDEADLPASDDVESAVLQSEKVRYIADALECLPERDREILRMKYFDEMTDAEIAQVIHIGVASVRTYLTRARKKLMRIFRERGIEL